MIGTYSADPFGTVTLMDDGTFSATDWPEFHYPNRPKHVGGGSGTWELMPEEKAAGLKSDLELTFSGKHLQDADFHNARDSEGSHFGVAANREKPRIYRFTTDPDIRELHRAGVDIHSGHDDRVAHPAAHPLTAASSQLPCLATRL
ncbi:hypothetical protein [Streptomyces sp. NPDC053079]|uniref:hypothetical protein n=1 Tax=Streptomyces sp. NPDC053079 TaxID=3365697 RepID=UPI0037D90594